MRFERASSRVNERQSAVGQAVGAAATGFAWVFPQYQAGHHAGGGRDRDSHRAVGGAGSQVRHPRSGVQRTFAYFLVAVASALFFFAVFGLYRAVIRFMGPKAMVTVVAGVSSRCWCWRCSIASSRATRFRCRPSASTGRWRCRTSAAAASWRGPVPARRWRHPQVGGARGDLWRRDCRGAPLLGPAGRPGLRAVAFIDDKKSLQGSNVSGIRVYGAGDPRGSRRAPERIDRILLAMPPRRGGGASRSLRALEPLGGARAVAAEPLRPDLRQGADQRAARRGRGRPPGARPRATEAEALGLMHQRQVRAGHRRRRLDRFGAVPADHPPESDPSGAVRDVGARAVHDPA